MRRASQTRYPSVWLFTDERLGGRNATDPLWRAVARLPRGAGIILRHYSWPEADRHALLARLAVLARHRGLILTGSRIAGAPGGTHRPRSSTASARTGLITAAAHSRRELLQAFRAGAHLVFLSPVFATASHPGAVALGPVRFGLMARGAPGPVLALGGMTGHRFRRLQALGASGFGAIDHWAQR